MRLYGNQHFSFQKGFHKRPNITTIIDQYGDGDLETLIKEVQNAVTISKGNKNVFNQIIERQLYRINADVGRWRKALSKAESVHTPNRSELMRVFQEVVLDSHLSALMQTRKLNVLSKKYELINADGEVNEEATKLIQSGWFLEFINLALDSIFYGYTLVQHDNFEGVSFDFIESVPRENIEPSKCIVKSEYRLLDGMRFDEPPISNSSFYVGKRKDYGLLNKAAPLAIWKKQALGNWADYSHIFGVPPRVGRTDVRDKKLRDNMDLYLKTMGRLSYAVLDHDDQLEVFDSKKGDPYNVFDKLTDRVNSEMSKLILGQTMTTDEGSSRSQAEVHERVSDKVNLADCTFIEGIMNGRSGYIQWLVNNWKLPLEGLTFHFPKMETLTQKEQFEMYVDLLNHYNIDPAEIEEKFSIKVEAKQSPISQPEPDEDQEQMAEIIEDVQQLYSGFRHNVVMQDEDFEELLTEGEQETLFQQIFSGKVTLFALPIALYERTHKTLLKGVTEGFGGTLNNFKNGTASHTILRGLRENIYRFSAAKTFQFVRNTSAARFDSAGTPLTFSQFKVQAQRIYNEFNVNHLKTEFNTSIAQAQGARKWAQIQDSKDTHPFLQYRTQEDGRVRDEHIVLEGTTRPVDDPIWDSIYPPNGYNCRCFVTQRRADEVQNSSNDKINNVVMAIDDEVDPLFRMNAGKEKKVFLLKHPYFRVPKGFGDKKDRNFDLNIPPE